MNRKKPATVGIDVSKDTFNAHFKGKDSKYENSRRGWQKLLKEAPPDALYAMEATGNYHYKLAAYLHSKNAAVMVLNPLRVRRWVQSLGNTAQNENDQIAAQRICSYASTEEGRSCSRWEPMEPGLARARAILTVLAGLAKLKGAAGNINHAVSFAVSKNDSLLGAMANVRDVCGEQEKALEKELCGIVSKACPQKFRLITSIPGIGAKTAACLLVNAKGLEFETHRQLASFIGVSPRVKESGTSVKVKGGIIKAGNPYLRALLFMCAFTACRSCEPCASLYNRLVDRGKAKKAAMVAVMHRLVKIAFGVVRSGEPYRGGFAA